MPSQIPHRYGHREVIGGRSTYFPPFVDERFSTKKDGGFWACTFASLLNGANVGYLGAKTPTHAEVIRLAVASGDMVLRDGANTELMLTALRNLYGQSLKKEHTSDEEAKDRLSKGRALVAGIIPRNYAQAFRVGITDRTEGHRILLVGMDAARTHTRVIDPMVSMAAETRKYSGRWIPWKVVRRAEMIGEEVWFTEGQFVANKVVPILTFKPSRRFGVKAGTRIDGYDGGQPTVIADSMVVSKDSGARFDALVDVVNSKTGARIGPFLRVISGHFQGQLVKVGAKGIVANVAPDAKSVVGAPGALAAIVAAHPAAPPAIGPLEITNDALVLLDIPVGAPYFDLSTRKPIGTETALRAGIESRFESGGFRVLTTTVRHTKELALVRTADVTVHPV